MSQDQGEHSSVTRFREYLRIKTVHPNPDYHSAIQWIKKQAQELNLQFNIVQFPPPDEFTVWLTWKGRNPQLKSLMLNSHIDVVPVTEEEWTFDPFAAIKDDNGNIFGRGTQDMKSVGVQYLEGIRCLKEKGFVPLRTVHLTFVPDEEVGGDKGMVPFVKSPEFASLNVGFAMDEGITSDDDNIILAYTERAMCQIKIIAKGTTGHALILHDNTAAEKLYKVIGHLLKFRDEEKKRLESNPNLQLGDVISINLTKLDGGDQLNTIPAEFHAYFDIRITPHWKVKDFLDLLDKFCQDAGVSYEFVLFQSDQPITILDDNNIWWKVFKETCDNMAVKVKPVIFPGFTDIRLVRRLGIPALGFSPITNTPVRLHSNDECLNEKIFLKGIDIYESLIWNLANIP